MRSWAAIEAVLTDNIAEPEYFLESKLLREEIIILQRLCNHKAFPERRAPIPPRVYYCTLCGRARRFRWGVGVHDYYRRHGRQHLLDLGPERLRAWLALCALSGCRTANEQLFGYRKGRVKESFWRELRAQARAK